MIANSVGFRCIGWAIIFYIALCNNVEFALASDSILQSASSQEASTSGPAFVQGPLEGTAIVAFRAGGAGHLGVAFYNSLTGKWIAGAIEGSPERDITNLLGAVVQTDEENGGWYKEFDTKEDVINEFFSNTEPDVSSGYPGHDAYDNINIIPVEKSYPGSASKIFVGIEDSGYYLTFNDCISLTNSVLSAYGVEDRPGGYDPLEAPLYNPNVLDLQETLIPNVYYYGLPGTKIPKESWDTSVESSFGDNKDLGGINFTSIKLNSISVSTNPEGGVNFDLTLNAQKADGTSPVIDPINATRLGAIAFMTGLAVSNNKFWVNLGPLEVDRIIDEELAHSDVVRIMLEADFQMKKDFSNYENPCANETGRALWKLLDEKGEELKQRCMNKFPGEIQNIDNVIFHAGMGHWINPDKVYVSSNTTQIYIINSTLTISSKEENSSFDVHNQEIGILSKGCLEELNMSAKEYGKYYKNLHDSMILPYVIADINWGVQYESLREVFAALALAQWFKSTSYISIFQDISNSSNSSVLESQDIWTPQKVWEKYIYSLKNREYICWQNTTTQTSEGMLITSRFYSSGGVDFVGISDRLIETGDLPLEKKIQSDEAISNGFINQSDNVLFGYRLHIDQKELSSIALSRSESSFGSLSLGQIRETTSSDIMIDNTRSLVNKIEVVRGKEPIFAKLERTELGSGTIDNTANLADEAAPIQGKENSAPVEVPYNASHNTCPEGWMGPDEKGECWQMQITG